MAYLLSSEGESNPNKKIAISKAAVSSRQSLFCRLYVSSATKIRVISYIRCTRAHFMFFKKKPDIKRLDDEELVTAYKRYEEPVYVGELYERYAHMVFLVCMKYLKDEAESEDAVMHLFEKLIVDLKRYEVRRFKFWIHTVAKNHCLVLIEKRNKQRHKVDEYRETAQALVESDPFPSLNGEDPKEVELRQLEAAIKLLNSEQQICVELFYLQQKCYKEVAEQTGYTLKQVKSYIQNGKRNLKNHLSSVNE